jgi:hypothetical protein
MKVVAAYGVTPSSCKIQQLMLFDQKAGLTLPPHVSQRGKAMHTVQHLLLQIRDGTCQDVTLSWVCLNQIACLLPLTADMASRKSAHKLA